jgi:hypothetical protein
MKKLPIIVLLSLSTVWSISLGEEKITKMIKEIKEERVGIKIEKLEETENPFILVKIKEKEENLTKEEKVIVKEIIVEKVYRLDAILNHSAFINKKWYKKGAKIDAYSVANIGQQSVLLKSSQGNKILHLKKKKYMKLH